MDYHDVRNTFCDILPILHKAAPIIGTLFGGPISNVIVGLLGVLIEENPCCHDKLAKKLKNDPDLYTKLANLEKTHAEYLSKL